jgi:hypothetical protein
MATVLEQERGCDGGIPRVHVHGGAVLRGGQKDFGQLAILEPADARGVVYSAVLETEQFVTAPVG